MDNTRISKKTFSVSLGFGGYLLTIAPGSRNPKFECCSTPLLRKNLRANCIKSRVKWLRVKSFVSAVVISIEIVNAREVINMP